MKHTPGPWHLQDNNGAHVIVRGKPEPGLSNGELIAKVWLKDTDFNEADAQLIVTAPEMLSTLKMAERLIEHRRGDCYSNDYMGICVCGKDKIKAVIAKAERKEKI